MKKLAIGILISLCTLFIIVGPAFGQGNTNLPLILNPVPPTPTATPTRTFAATPTRTSTPTNTPTATLTPSPAPKPVDIVLHDGYSCRYWYSDYDDYIQLYTEIVNNSSSNLRGIEVVLAVRSKDGVLLATDTSGPDVSHLRPGQHSSVDFFLEVPGGADAVQAGAIELRIRDTYESTQNDPQANWQLVTWSHHFSDGWMRVIGEAQNVSQQEEDLDAVVIIYGDDSVSNMIMDSGSDWVSDVQPGETVPFEVTFYKNLEPYFDHYVIVLQ